MKITIKDITEKTSANGAKFLVVNHETGRCACWHKEFFDTLEVNRGKILDVDIVKKGDFYNIEKVEGVDFIPKPMGAKPPPPDWNKINKEKDEKWAVFNKQKQEDILRGMCFNGAVALAEHYADTMTAKQTLEKVQELYIGLWSVIKNTELK